MNPFLRAGAMAASASIGSVERLRAQAADEVVSANVNGRQIVIAGHAAAVRRACEAAVAVGALRAVPLQVSAPFHCALMEPAARRLSVVLAATTFCDPSIPVYTNVDAAPVAAAAAAREALVRQVASSVRWDEEILRMAEDGIDTFVEFGPGRVLSGLVRRIRKDSRFLFDAGLPRRSGAGELSWIRVCGRPPSSGVGGIGRRSRWAGSGAT
jgi:[acyl-carrier-protein] S-malonyltransferase